MIPWKKTFAFIRCKARMRSRQRNTKSSRRISTTPIQSIFKCCNYYTLKEQERREIYSTKCMKYLTFLDYLALEASGKSVESKLLRQKGKYNYYDKEIL